jgi:hypothetical protein
LRSKFAPRRQEMVNDFATLYARRFSESEMKEAIAFYRSPVGKKFAAEEPAVVDQGLEHIQSISSRLSQEVFNRMRAEMKKKGHDL